MTPYFQNAHGELYNGDCLEVMEWLPTRYAPFDMVLTDPPYGTTACKWDAVIPLEPMWRGVWGITSGNASVVMTANQPFTSALGSSQLRALKYGWVWVKNRPTGSHHSKNRPMGKHEDVLVFSHAPMGHVSQLGEKRMRYFPQGASPLGQKVVKERGFHGRHIGARPNQVGNVYVAQTGLPNTVLSFPKEETHIHPTQKPVALFSYLIKTYTNPGETVLDFCAGSGTTAVAAQETGRRWVMIEKEEKYCEIIAKRLDS